MEKLARRRGMPSVTNPNTPRSIRTRLAAPRRRTGEPLDAAPRPESPNQPVARSVSGKHALGPWMGSFGAVAEGGLLDGEPSSPTLFATSQGAVFSDLQGSPVSSFDLGADVEAAAQAAPQHPEASRLAMLATRAELGVLRRKAEAPRRVRSASLAGMGARPNAARRRMRQIGQARKHN